ncbi:class II lanthipeptide, LchA2/BrtA2 family [Bacillus paramycoides]|uniref:class II lanthipeptide, LchA2/BrtA2 family n=1 Tax=Bacillus paramycoides TaxID=2026194 RepID=UPI003182F951
MNHSSYVNKKKLRENFNFEETIGLVDEKELAQLSGAGSEVNPRTAWACVITGVLSAAQCPSTACSSRCTK